MNKKILCIGAEIQQTDFMVSQLATQNQSHNHGLIVSIDFVPLLDGYYHTSAADLDTAGILKISHNFDQIIMLDQPISSYNHFKSFVTVFKLMCDLEDQGHATVFRENKNNQNISYWYDYLRTNKSFCAYPFSSYIENHEKTSLCCKNPLYIKFPKDITDWKSDPDYKKIRDRMIKGELDWEQCGVGCYSREREGVESTRQFETLETAMRLGMRSVEDFVNLDHPTDYEVRPSNKCNIMCRMCDSNHSHLIDKEWKRIGIKWGSPKTFVNTPFESIDIDTAKRIYIAGGEPTIMPEVYEFFRKCIDRGRTDFELLIGTNGMKVSNKLLRLLEHFPDVCFSVSFDGYKKINDYIRWGSDFDTIMHNTKLLKSHGHKIGFQTVFSIYNNCRIHEIFEFYDTEFPGCSTLSQPASFKEDILSPYNYPNPVPVLASLYRCTKTRVYHANGRSTKTLVDSLIQIYSDPDYRYDKEKLSKFFTFNDKLDQSRNSRLGDYIPELEDCRKLTT